LVWVIPIIAALVGVCVVVTRIESQGPEITIAFESAQGLEAGKPKIEYKGVEVGTITSIELAPDHQRGVDHRPDGAEDGRIPVLPNPCGINWLAGMPLSSR
jgi:ABC-type transporter Mla subunit MlaD